MCSVTGGIDRDEVIELAKLNEYRGTHSHSIALYSFEMNELFYLKRDLGPINYDDDIDIPEEHLCIIHQQAPTTESRDQMSIHPASFGDHYLWHNGILKPSTIKSLQEEYESFSKWDTKLMLYQLINKHNVHNLDGSFACTFVDPYGVWLFRNEIAPMFVSGTAFSSTKFDGSEQLDAGSLFKIKYETLLNRLDYQESGVKFETVNNPYYFGE